MVLRRNCHLYANFERDKEKTRAGARSRSRFGKAVAEWGEGGGRDEEREENLIYEYTCCYTSGKVLPAEGLFLSRLTRCARDQTTENVFYFSKRDVWRQFYCAFHSVGRFEIQARIPFVLEQRGDKGGEGTGGGVILYRCREDYER